MNNIFKRSCKLIILNLIIIIMLFGCTGKGSIEIQKEAVSPNGQYVAYAYIWENGATTPFIPKVSIIDAKEVGSHINNKLLSEDANIYVATRSSNKNIDIEWIDDKSLKVYYSNQEEDIYLKVDVFNGINIIYEKSYI